MRRFEIYDSTKRGHAPCAILQVDERGGASIRILEGVDASEVPMLFIPFIEKGIREIPDKWARRWIEDRVVPPGRQNLGEVLRANGLIEYDQIELLARGKGRSSHDDFLVRETTECVEYEHARLGSLNQLEPSKEFAVELGSRFRQLRRSAGLTQSALSERTGIRQEVISRIESGKANPTVFILLELASGLGADLQVVLNKKDEG